VAEKSSIIRRRRGSYCVIATPTQRCACVPCVFQLHSPKFARLR